MHPYTSHLLADIKNAHKPKGYIPAQKSATSFEEEMKEMEDWVSGKHDDGRQPFRYYCELKSEDFPPPDQLTESEMEQVALAFKEMVQSWNILISVPDRYPPQMKYELMVNFLDQRVFIPRDGAFLGIDNCTGEPDGCFFGEFCPCLEFRKNDL